MLKYLFYILVVLPILLVLSCSSSMEKATYTARNNHSNSLDSEVIEFVEDILNHRLKLSELLNEYLIKINKKDERIIKNAVECQNVIKNVRYDSINVVYSINKTEYYNKRIVKYEIELRYFFNTKFTRKVFLKFEELDEKLYLTYSSDIGFEPVLFGKDP